MTRLSKDDDKGLVPLLLIVAVLVVLGVVAWFLLRALGFKLP
jgi:hypothetical protein